MDREPIYFDHAPPPSSGHGFYSQHETMTFRVELAREGFSWTART